MTSARDALAAMGVSVDEAIEADKSQKDRKPRDPRVCLCGHAINRHTTPAGVVYCKPSQLDCDCKKIEAVIEVEDTRLFLRKTNGPGLEHALIRGMSALADAGKEAKWLVPIECAKCKTTEGAIMPAPINIHSSTVANESTGYNALLCQDCIVGL
jgi:hypothetical protein